MSFFKFPSILNRHFLVVFEFHINFSIIQLFKYFLWQTRHSFLDCRKGRGKHPVMILLISIKHLRPLPNFLSVISFADPLSKPRSIGFIERSNINGHRAHPHRKITRMSKAANTANYQQSSIADSCLPQRTNGVARIPAFGGVERRLHDE